MDSIRLLMSFMLLATAGITVLDATAPCCVGSDCIQYDCSTQSICVEVTSEAPTYDCRWSAGQYSNIDQKVKGGRIAAYKIQWSTGWSQWFVPGVNDMDIKFNLATQNCAIPYLAKSMRHMWAYFYDHTHSYIICKDP